MRFAAPSRPALPVLILLLLCWWPGIYVHAEEKVGREYSFAIIPVVPPSDTKRRWQPLLDQLSRDTGLHFRLRFYEDFPDFENGLEQDEPDFAVMAPWHIWRYRHHYRPQLRGTLPLTGIVVVKSESNIKGLADLRGQLLALQEGENLSSNSFVLKSLKEQKIDAELHHVKTESNALRSVVMGKADAAIVNNYALKFVPVGIMKKLRIIHHTEDLPPPPLASNFRLPESDVVKIRNAILRMKTSNPALLQEILMPDLMEADMDRDYTVVGEIFPGEDSDVHR